MIYNQKWSGARIHNGIKSELFGVEVPGNIQYDYAQANGFRDVYFADGCKQFDALEGDEWEYSARLNYERKCDERVWFVSLGIDYKFTVYLNGEELYENEGMFSPVELDLTDKLTGDDTLTVRSLRFVTVGIGTRGFLSRDYTEIHTSKQGTMDTSENARSATNSARICRLPTSAFSLIAVCHAVLFSRTISEIRYMRAMKRISSLTRLSSGGATARESLLFIPIVLLMINVHLKERWDLGAQDFYVISERLKLEAFPSAATMLP